MNRTIKIVMIAVQMLAPLSCFSQYFQRLHDIDSSGDFGWNVLIEDDGSYFVSSGAHSNTTFKAAQAWMNISQDGYSISNLHSIASDSANYYQGLLPGLARRLTIGGYLLPVTLQRAGKSALGLIKINQQYDTVWARFYTDTSIRFEDVEACIVMPNGDYMIGGYTAPNGAPRDSALIMRIDSAGNIIWSRRYKKLPGSTERPCIVNLDLIDGNTILVGAMSTHRVWISQFEFYGHNTPWFMLIDSQGNIIKDTAYVNMHYAGGGRIYKDVFGGYYHVGAFDSCFTQDPLDLENFPEYIAHLNDNFEIDWIRNFGTWDGHKYIWQVKQLSNGDIQLSGANGVNDDQRLKGWAARVNHEGWTIWDNDYTCDTNWSSYLVDFDVRQDGSLVLVGAARNDTIPQWRGQELWLVSVDANGCLVPGCAPTVVRTAERKGGELLVYPNPTSGSFSVESEGGRLLLLSIDGRVLREYELKQGKQRLQLPPGLAAGVYMVKYRGEEGERVVRLTYQP